MDPGAPEVSETYGQRERSMYNDHFACERYNPLFVSNDESQPPRAARWFKVARSHQRCE